MPGLSSRSGRGGHHIGIARRRGHAVEDTSLRLGQLAGGGLQRLQIGLNALKGRLLCLIGCDLSLKRRNTLLIETKYVLYQCRGIQPRSETRKRNT